MKGNIGQLMKQAQQMQENMRRMQESLATLEVEGQSGAGMVKIQMTCKYEVKRVAIDPSLVGDDREMLEDLLTAAFNDASRKVEATIARSAGVSTTQSSARSRRAERHSAQISSSLKLLHCRQRCTLASASASAPASSCAPPRSCCSK